MIAIWCSGVNGLRVNKSTVGDDDREVNGKFFDLYCRFIDIELDFGGFEFIMRAFENFLSQKSQILFSNFLFNKIIH